MKLIRYALGSNYRVIVDLRSEAPAYLRLIAEELYAVNGRWL